MAAPDISIVMASFNRGHLVCRAVDSLLAQTGGEMEVVVVDASTDDTPKALRAIDDPRVKVLFRPNLGMSANRNAGLAHATGTWLAYLDDDDFVSEDWSDILLGAATEKSGLVVAGHVNVDVASGSRTTVLPRIEEVTPFGFLAGAFIARRDAVVEVGGMLEGLPMAHHWDLAVRLVDWCERNGYEVTLTDRSVVEIEMRDVSDRLQYSPTMTFDGKRWARARHHVAVADHPRVRVIQTMNIGVPAFRLGRVSEARRWLALAVKDRPFLPEAWGRLIAATVTPVGRRRWGTLAPAIPETGPRASLRAVPPLVEVRGSSTELLMLPYRYQERTETRGDAAPAKPERRSRADGWAELARLCAKATGPRSVAVVDVDAAGEPLVAVGRLVPGSGDPEQRFEGEATTWDAIPPESIDLILLPSSLERAPEPYALLAPAVAALRASGSLVVSTPDRNVVDGPLHLGPPSGQRARRHWTGDQLVLLLEAMRLRIVRARPAQPELIRRRRGTSLVVTAVKR